MGTKCCWKENKDNSENQKDVEVNKTDTKKKESQKDNQKKNVNIKRKSLKSLKEIPLQNNKSKEDVKKENVGDIQDKRSSTASFHSATSCNDTKQNQIANNNDIIDEKYQG